MKSFSLPVLAKKESGRIGFELGVYGGGGRGRRKMKRTPIVVALLPYFCG